MAEPAGTAPGKSLQRSSLGSRKALLTLVLVALAVSIWSTVRNEYHDLQVRFLKKARIVSSALNRRNISQLSASEADLVSPAYQRLKEQLTGVHQASPHNRFVYLLKQRPDGTVLFLVDSEPPSSTNYSPPGQVYKEASATICQVFANGLESTIGPYSNRRGRWVSALVPILEPETGRVLALLGMDINAREWYLDLVRETAKSLAMILVFLVPLAIYLVQRRRAEQALRVSRDEWQNTFDSMPDLIAILDSEHRIVRANRAMREKLQLDATSLIGHHCCRHIHQQDAPPDFCPHARLLKDGESHQEEAFLPVLNGYYSISATPLYDAAGGLTGSIHIVHDVTERKQAEEALKASEEQFRLQFEKSNDALFVTIPDGTILSANSEACSMFGMTGEEFSQCGRDAIIDPSDERFKGAFEARARSGKFNGELNFVRKNGEIFPGDVSSIIFTDSSGNIRSTVRIRDITERKQMETALRESEFFFKESQRAGFIGSYKCNFTTYSWESSEVLDQIFGIDESYCRSIQGWIDIVHPDDREMIDRYLRKEVKSQHNTFNQRYRIIRKCDGVTRWVRGLGKAGFDAEGNVVSLIGTIQDITERKQVADDLNRKNAEIEQLIYTVSHDLRSPLVTVKIFLGYLEQDMSAADNERIGKDLEFIHSAANRMESLLNELLEMSRIGRAIRPHEEVTFRVLTAEALDAVAGQISAGKVDVRVSDADLLLCGDRRRLLQIWQNLLENAIKYIGNQTEPLIEIGVKKDQGETVFYVNDNGIGIAPEHQEKVFGLFEQLDQNSGGIGMGLTMVRRIVEHYGGRIRVESAGVGQGSCFRFTLPDACKENM